MSDVVIILAGGASERWAQHGGEGYKHLLEVDGEPLLRRTVRLVGQSTGELPVVVLPPEPEVARLYTAAILPYDFSGQVASHGSARTHHDVAMYRSTRGLWSDSGRTTYLYGDTYYTDEAMCAILAPMTTGWHMWARFTPSAITGKPWAEVWAHAFVPHAHAAEDGAIESAAGYWRTGVAKRATIWEMHKSIAGRVLPFSYHQEPSALTTTIDDWTEDFDFPTDYERFTRRRNRRAT